MSGDLPLPKPDPIKPEDDAAENGGLGQSLKHLVLGKPRDLADKKLLHRISLIALLAWVGLGADGLSSSAYGPEEAYRALGEHHYLALVLAVVVAATVFLISAAYSRIIEEFPQGGGGYLVASALLGPVPGALSGSALLVDYILTITISIAAAGDALFSFLPIEWLPLKLTAEVMLVAGLTILNMRGVKESVIALAPVFFVFVLTHVVFIVGGVIAKSGEFHLTGQQITQEVNASMPTLGIGGLLMVLIYAYSLGGGTYTGIEAVSNGVPLMREPRVRTAKHTMIYMAVSLAFTAGGLLCCYLLWRVEHRPGMTLNAALVQDMVRNIPGGTAFWVVTMLSEGALLVVAAQAGFLDGPRVLANMALDKWVPSRFAALSERLTGQNGILLMGGAALAALIYTNGDVRHIVVMYSINVFLTFSLSMLGMLIAAARGRLKSSRKKSRIVLFGVAFAACATILGITIFEKFSHGGWVTLAVTGLCVCVCLLIRRHYRNVSTKVAVLQSTLDALPQGKDEPPRPLDPKAPTAVVLVSAFNGPGVHTVLSVLKFFPNHFKNLLFVSVGIADSASMREENPIEKLRERTQAGLTRYVRLAHGLGLPSRAHLAIGTDVAEEAAELCLELAKEFPHCTFFSGQLVFKREYWFQSILHNQTAFDLQRRLHLAGKPAMVLPVRVN
ncbi:MAG: APC family permease [Planctomycetes bacterium]|nr:APC family permease [Planctomycetota bacterium]